MDYINYWGQLSTIIEDFDQSIEVFHPEKWFNMTKTGTTENGLVDKTISGLYEVAKNMNKLADNAEERCRKLWEFLLLGDDKKAQKYFIGDISKYTKEEWCEALDLIFIFNFKYIFQNPIQSFTPLFFSIF